MLLYNFIDIFTLVFPFAELRKIDDANTSYGMAMHGRYFCGRENPVLQIHS